MNISRNKRLIFKLLEIAAVLSALVLSAACTKSESGSFTTPKIVWAEATVVNHIDYSETVLKCTLSSKRVERCGFVYGVAGSPPETVYCNLIDYSFELELGGLTPGATYEWFAFASAGESEIRSSTFKFSVEPEPEEEPEPGDEPGSKFVYFEDQNFKNWLTEHHDTDGDGEISVEEALAVNEIDVCTANITSLKGIEYFTNLTSLKCRGGEQDVSIYGLTHIPGGKDLKKIDLRANTLLKHLECDGNWLEDVFLPEGSELEYLSLSGCMVLGNLDLTGKYNLKYLDCSGTLFSPNLAECKNLIELNISWEWAWFWYPTPYWNIIDVSMLPNLTKLKCSQRKPTWVLIVSSNQVIEGVTQNRSYEIIPEETEILVVDSSATVGDLRSVSDENHAPIDGVVPTYCGRPDDEYPTDLFNVPYSMEYFEDRLETVYSFKSPLFIINDHVFRGSPGITELYLPSSLRRIGAYCFADCVYMERIVCLADNPPEGSNNMFTNTGKAPIYVPAESVEKYRTAQYWSEYADRIFSIEDGSLE